MCIQTMNRDQVSNSQKYRFFNDQSTQRAKIKRKIKIRKGLYKIYGKILMQKEKIIFMFSFSHTLHHGLAKLFLKLEFGRLTKPKCTAKMFQEKENVKCHHHYI